MNQQTMDEFNHLMENQELFEMNYEVIDVLTQTGHSSILLVRDHNNQQFIAKKVSYDYESIVSEYEMLKVLRHPSLPKVYNIYKTVEAIYIIIEQIKGETLYDLIMREGKLHSDLAVTLVLQLMDVVEYLHKHDVIHRDIKPQNIMVHEGQVYLIDFDAARTYKSENTTDTMVVGTRGYAAPEQYGYHQSDHRADIYAIGASFYYLLSGNTLYDDEGKWLKESDMNKGLKEIITRATAFNPKDRYNSIAVMKKKFTSVSKPRKPIMIIGTFFVVTCFVLYGFFNLINQYIEGKSIDAEVKAESVIEGESSPVVIENQSEAGNDEEGLLQTVVEGDTDNSQEEIASNQVSDDYDLEKALKGEIPIQFSDPAFERVIRIIIENESDPIYIDDIKLLSQIQVIGNEVVLHYTEFSYVNGKPENGEDLVHSYTYPDGTVSRARGGIKTLDDLIYTPNVFQLSISKNMIRNIEGIKHLKDLREIYLVDNEIEDVSAIGKRDPTTAYLSANNIKDLTQLEGALPTLLILELNYNKLADVSSIVKATQLETLDLGYNKIKKIVSLDFNSHLNGNEFQVYRGNPIE